MNDSTHSSHQLTKHVKFVHKVCVVSGSKILILKRSGSEKTRPNLWDLPGGNMEWPSSKSSANDLHQAQLAREVVEETGLKLDRQQFITNNLVYFETYFDQPTQVFKIYCGWRVSLPKNVEPDSIRLSPEHSGFAWITRDEIDSYDFGGVAGAFIKKQLKNSFK